jgi:chromosome partitioning protein
MMSSLGRMPLKMISEKLVAAIRQNKFDESLFKSPEKVVSICSMKGGSGRSTIAINLAACFHRMGYRTVIIDNDVKRDCLTCSHRAKELGLDGPQVVSSVGRKLYQTLKTIPHCDITIIDCPREYRESIDAMLLADLIIIPVIPSAVDLWAFGGHTIRALNEAQEHKLEKLRAKVVLNLSPVRGDRSDEVREAISPLREVSVFDEIIHQRITYAESICNGIGVIDYEPNSMASFEIQHFSKSVLFELVNESKEPT